MSDQDFKVIQSEHDDEIDLFELFSILWKRKWLIIATSLGAGILALIITLFMPNIYRAEAVIKPVKPESKVAGLAQQLGGIPSGFGIGSSGSLQDLEVLLKSKDLTVRVFEKYGLYSKVFNEMYDEKTGNFKSGGGFFSSKEPPGEWDAIRASQNMLRVTTDVKKGIIRLSFETESPNLSASIVGYYLEEAKTRLQEQALAKAKINKKFLEDQLQVAVDPLAKERLYFLYGKEIEKEMLAKNREQFAFTIIDPPKIPDMKIKPHRGLIAIMTTLFSSFIFLFLILFTSKIMKK